jgi:signal transduction histidine kinase
MIAARPGVPGRESLAGEARAVGDMQRIAEEQAALRRVAVLVARGESPEDVFAAVAVEAGRVVHAQHSWICRYDPDDTVSVVATWTSSGTALIPIGTRVGTGGRNLTTLVLQTGRSARLDDYGSATGPGGVRARESGIRATVGVPVSVEGRLWGTMAVGSTREPLPAGTEARLAAFTELAAAAIANAQARAELRNFAAEQAALRRVAVLVARGAPPEEVFAAVAGEAARVLGPFVMNLARYDPDRAETVVGAWTGTVAVGATVGTRKALGGRNVSTMVFETGRPARIDDNRDFSGEIGKSAHEVGAQASVGVPVSVEGRLWGIMIATSTQGPLPAGIEARLAAFTELAATAIANAEAQAALAASRARIMAATDATRRRIERDLHDGVQQRLVSLGLQLRAAQAAAAPGADELAAQLDGAVTEVTGVLEELREIASGLHPAILAEGGLRSALRTLARRSAVPVCLDVRVARRLPEPIEVAAYYAVAEALTNTAKHAGASAIEVEVAGGEGVLRVRVRDDGRGGARFGRGSGLVGLKDRIEALGGQVSLDSLPGAGTALDIALPLGGPGGS